MTEIIVIVIFVLAFLCVTILLANLFVKSKKQNANPEKPAEAKPEEKVDDIPEILKDVTMGNYLYDSAKLSENEQLAEDMVENKNIEKTTQQEKPFRVELGEYLDDEYDDHGGLTTTDILDELDKKLDNDQELEGEETDEKVENEPHSESVSEEIKKLSPKMKAILISNMLNKKDDI